MFVFRIYTLYVEKYFPSYYFRNDKCDNSRRCLSWGSFQMLLLNTRCAYFSVFKLYVTLLSILTSSTNHRKKYYVRCHYFRILLKQSLILSSYCKKAFLTKLRNKISLLVFFLLPFLFSISFIQPFLICRGKRVVFIHSALLSFLFCHLNNFCCEYGTAFSIGCSWVLYMYEVNHKRLVSFTLSLHCQTVHWLLAMPCFKLSILIIIRFLFCNDSKTPWTYCVNDARAPDVTVRLVRLITYTACAQRRITNTAYFKNRFASHLNLWACSHWNVTLF